MFGRLHLFFTSCFNLLKASWLLVALVTVPRIHRPTIATALKTALTRPQPFPLTRSLPYGRLPDECYNYPEGGILDTCKWPGGVLVYQLDDSVSGEVVELIEIAQAKITNATDGCLKFRKRTVADPAYVFITSALGCTVTFGYTPQLEMILSLDDFCFEGDFETAWTSPARGFLLAFGAWHENCREDRDDYIQIHYDNIRLDYWYSFEKIKGITYDLPYEYNSLMHFGRFQFSMYGYPTITPKQSVIIGQRDRITELDALKIKRLYGCA